jgi:hypothetical protein
LRSFGGGLRTEARETPGGHRLREDLAPPHRGAGQPARARWRVKKNNGRPDRGLEREWGEPGKLQRRLSAAEAAHADNGAGRGAVNGAVSARDDDESEERHLRPKQTSRR